MILSPSFPRVPLLLFATLLPVPQATAAFVAERTLASPGGALVMLIERDDVTGKLAWSVTHGGRPVLTRGALGIEISGTGVVGDEGTISAVASRSVDTSWIPPYGERSVIPDRFNEEILTIQHTGNGSLTVKLELRAYDEGIALRYRIEGSGPLTVASEKTSYPLPSTSQVWVSTTAQASISKVAISSMGNGMERPLTAELAPDLFAAFGEADLRDHARMKFNRSGSSTLVPVLASTVAYPGSFSTPWRYVRAATTASGLLNANHLPLNLSAPSTIADTSWIRPGKVLREVTLTTAGGIASVDWAAENGIDFIHFDAGWYGNEYDDASDATTVTVDPARSPGPLDLPAVIAHAKSKGLGVLLYVNRRALETQLDEILPLYRQWGVDGIKFGFVNVGSQQWTKWLHDSIAACAEHELMVNVHDEYRMTGVERTLPNFMTAEGIRGDEESTPNEMALRTIFTRGLAGAGDQTNCYFASRVATMGSHASQLAKSVLIYSPWQYLYWYDSPPASPNVGGKSSVIQDVPELSFFKRLPTVWDETRWLGGHPESHAVAARRKGDTWFLAALNGATARDLTVPLDFLAAGQNYRIELFSDDPEVVTVTDVQIESGVIDRNHVIQRTLAIRKGLTAILTPTGAPLAALVKTVEVTEPPTQPTSGITFETGQGYAAGAIGTGSGTDLPFTGQQGWSLGNGRIVTTSNSGEYAGGQALSGSNSGTQTYIGGLKGVIESTSANSISFDAQYRSGVGVGFIADADNDGFFDGSPDAGMQFGIGGPSNGQFGYRNANFGTETFSGVTGTAGNWYRFQVLIGESVNGSRAIQMSVRNLTTATNVDLNGAAAGTVWSFTVTDAQFGIAPQNALGGFVRVTTDASGSNVAKIDNLSFTAASPYKAWATGGVVFDADTNNDGVENGLAWVLGAANPSENARERLPIASLNGNNLRLTFRCLRSTKRGGAFLKVQTSADLGVTDPWTEHETAVSDADGTANGITFDTTDDGDFIQVIADIPTGGAKLFARLSAEEPAP